MKRIDQKKESPVTEKEVSGKAFEQVFLPWTAILILSHLLTMYLAPAYMWGVHFYHFYPAWIGWILTLGTLAILLPGVGGFLYERMATFARKISKPFGLLGPNKTNLILSLFSLPIFWILRTRFHLLGDGYFRIRDLPEGRLHLQEWLDGFIHLVAHRVMIKIIPAWTSELTYSIISILCGGVFVFLALNLCSLLARTGVGKVLIFFFLISLGSIQLFFGYVESYSILQVALLAYVWFAALHLSGKLSIIPASLAFVFSVGLHVTSLILVPSLIYLVTRGQFKTQERKASSGSVAPSARRRSARKRKRDPGKKSVGSKAVSSFFVFVALAAASAAVVFWIVRAATGLEETGKGIFILPLVPTQSYSFGMFSLGHISEFLNQLLLLSPVGISLLVFFSYFKIKYREFEDSFANFLLFVVSSGLVYLFAFNFTLGSADWDLRSSPAPFIGLLGAYLFLRWGGGRSAEKRQVSKGSAVESFSGGKRFKAWCLIFIWFGLFHTIPWVLINASHPKSVARYVLIQERDPHPVDEAGYNLFKIARILELAGLPEEMKDLYQRATQRNPSDTSSYFNLANWYHRQRDFDRAMLILDTLIRLDPAHPKANWLIGNIHLKKKDQAKALPYLVKAAPYFAHDTDFLSGLGAAYYLTNQPEKAVACARQMIELRPDYLKAYYLLGRAYVKLGDFENARKTWGHILSINPGDSIAIRHLKIQESRPEK